LSDFKKSGGKKRKLDVRLKKWDVKSQKIKETQIRETMRMPCNKHNNTKIASQKRGKMGGKKGCQKRGLQLPWDILQNSPGPL